MKLRFEFEEPDDRGRRRVRAYDGDECAMSGILDPQIVNVTPPVVHLWCPMHEDREAELDGSWPVGTPVTSIRMVNERAHNVIAQLVAAMSKWHVFVFIDNCPWVIEGVPGYGTEAEADAFVDGFHYYAGEDTRAIRWPFTAPELAKVLHEVDAEALMVDVLARVAAMGLVTM